MRFLAAFLFISTVPFVIFLASIMFTTGLSSTLKTELAQTGVYQQLSDQIAKAQTDDPQTQAVYDFVKDKFTPDYLQGKAETAIDDSSDWISGKTQTPPVVSFKDVKDDLIANNPQLYAQLQSALHQAEEQAAAQQSSPDDSSTDNQTAQMAAGIKQMMSLMQSDFTFKLDKYLIGLKSFNSLLHIVLPVLLVLSLIYLGLLFLLSKTWSSRLQWFGWTLLISGILGFGTYFFDSLLVKSLIILLANNTNQTVKVAEPIIAALVNLYVNHYLTYQKIASIGFVVIAIISFIVAKFSSHSAPVTQPAKASPATASVKSSPARKKK